MARTLTTPIARTSLTVATLDNWGVTIVRNPDNTVNLQQSELFAMFSFRVGNTLVNQQRFNVKFSSLPAAVGTAGRNFHSALLTAAQNAGLLPPGTDTLDF